MAELERTYQLAAAVRRCNDRDVSAMIARGAYVEGGDDCGKVALEYAAQAWASHSQSIGDPCVCSDLRIVRQLLDAGAKPRGDVLSFAMNSRNPALIVLLLDRKLVSDVEKAAIVDVDHAQYKYAERGTRKAVEAWLLGDKRGVVAECLVCSRVFGSAADADPAVLAGCGHSLCVRCAKMHLVQKRCCPTCSAPIVRSASVNWSLKAMLDALSTEELASRRRAAEDAAMQLKEHDTHERAALRGGVILKEKLVFPSLEDAPNGGVIGSGACGQVRMARHKGHHVAVKTLHIIGALERGGASADSIEASFYEEVRALSELRHANVVHFVGSCVDYAPGTVLLVMELCQGGSLDQLIRDRGKRGLDVDVATGIASDIALALKFVHEMGRKHGDVKPQNVVLTEGSPRGGSRPTRPVAKLCDFGLARMVMGHLPQTDTRMGKAAGTVAYMAPELWGSAGRSSLGAMGEGSSDSSSGGSDSSDDGETSGDEGGASGGKGGATAENFGHIRQRSDVWALTLVLWSMLAGKEPWEGKMPAQIIGYVCATHTRPKLPRRLREVSAAAVERKTKKKKKKKKAGESSSEEAALPNAPELRWILAHGWKFEALARPTAGELFAMIKLAEVSKGEERDRRIRQGRVFHVSQRQRLDLPTREEGGTGRSRTPLSASASVYNPSMSPPGLPAATSSSGGKLAARPSPPGLASPFDITIAAPRRDDDDVDDVWDSFS